VASGAAVIDPPDWLAPRLADLHNGPHRTGSLIITLYGDAIAPRGGSLALASLLAIMAALGIGEGVVRTAVSRLAAEGWLERRRIGRSGFYRLAAKGAETFAAATRRIYGAPPRREDPRLDVVVLGPASAREAARAALEAAGFGGLAPGVFVAPAGTAVPPLTGALRLTAEPAPGDAAALAALAWPLAGVADRYRHFLAVWAGAGPAPAPEPLTALVARVLLIHDYRRAVLRDPLLPAALLPSDWPQPAARALCARIWRRLLEPSEAWLDAHAIAEGGALPAPDAALAARFADLAET
jgi:phenylacetic acid degradation operon negative regulatory protein